jgi:hypothetical protein
LVICALATEKWKGEREIKRGDCLATADETGLARSRADAPQRAAQVSLERR